MQLYFIGYNDNSRSHNSFYFVQYRFMSVENIKIELRMSSAARDLCIFHGSDSLLTGDFSTSGQVAVTGGKGRTVSLWDTDGGDKIMSMPPHMTDVTSVTFKGDNSAVGSGDANGLLKIWDLREARLQRNLDGMMNVNSSNYFNL